jgi:glycosyltransferase involved in cell wall biosynthesis
MKVALIGSRVGYIDRGFESFTRTLFDLVKNDLDITLFKGSGTRSSREIAVPSLWCDRGILSRMNLPVHKRLLLNERTYALGMLPHLLGNQYDVIHFSEVVLGKLLWRIRGLFGLKYKLLFSNGAPAPPLFYRLFDMTQEVTAVRLDEAREYGIPEARLSLVPYGIDCQRFTAVERSARLDLRRKYGVPEDRFVIVSAAAIKRHHKRIDHLIDEMASLAGDKYFLLVAGHRTEETPELEARATKLLGNNFRFITVPHEQMHEVYQLADLFTLASLTEGLGIVILEAMATSLPVLVHADKSFRWVVGHEESLVDMSRPGVLAAAVARFAADEALRTLTATALCQNARSRFDWKVLRNDYLSLYDRAFQLSRAA